MRPMFSCIIFRMAEAQGKNNLPNITIKASTGLPDYSDSAGTAIKCRCKRGASYCVIVSKKFYCMKAQLGAQKRVTVSGELLILSL